MSDRPTSPPTSPPELANPPSPLRCWLGSLIASGLALALYNLTTAIAQAFANKPNHYANITTTNISVAVRTLVVGLSALGTGIFALAALGLLGLGLQLLLKGPTSPLA
jgi:Protein of unknown function (DUF3082)